MNYEIEAYNYIVDEIGGWLSLVHFAADEGPWSETFFIYGPLNYIQIMFNQPSSYFTKDVIDINFGHSAHVQHMLELQLFCLPVCLCISYLAC